MVYGGLSSFDHKERQQKDELIKALKEVTEVADELWNEYNAHATEYQLIMLKTLEKLEAQ
jgi:hypothetical protein